MRIHASGLLISLVISFLLFTGCEQQRELSPYEQAIWQSRFEKNMRFRDPKRTILRPEDLARFQGLDFFPVDSSYRFEVPLHRLATPETTWVSRRKGQLDPYLKIGYIQLKIKGIPAKLAVFHIPETSGDWVWIPFTDSTTGIDTYGGGRYLDAPLQRNGTVLVDFNLAYNPLCAYNPYDYNCAVPPRENRLPVAIRAGEKKSHLFEFDF